MGCVMNKLFQCCKYRDMARILLFGSQGMLGRTLCHRLSGFDIVPASHSSVDIVNSDTVDALVEKVKPEVVINCAAMTQVDLCESEQDKAFAVNALGAGNIASASNRCGAKLYHISTDYVFDGVADKSYSEFDEPHGCQTVYGKSKLAGECLVRSLAPNHVIARVSWLYGAGGPSFVHTMLKLSERGLSELKVVSDQVGNPTSCDAVAKGLQQLLQHSSYSGTIHLTCEGQATWYEFACEIFAQAGIRQKVIPCTTEEYPRPAPRPRNSRLDKSVLRLLGFEQMQDWRMALHDFITQEWPQSDNICSKHINL